MEKQRFVRFVDKLDFNELEEWQMFTMVDWKLAIINPTEEDRRDYYLEQQAEYEMEEMAIRDAEELDDYELDDEYVDLPF
jgi:hypothetical protein